MDFTSFSFWRSSIAFHCSSRSDRVLGLCTRYKSMAALPAAAAAGAFAPAATYDAAAVATVVAHAAARGIRVVPEFDTPAHAGGFFLSRPDLFCGDTYADAVLDPTQEAVYEFLDALYASSAALFPDAVLHVGGDEVSTACWNASASVRAWLDARNATVASLYGYYEARAVAIAARAGRAPMAWDEAFADPVARAGLDPRRAIVHAWNGPGGSPVTSDPRLAAAVAAGFRAVSSHGFYLTAGDGVDADLVVKWEHLYDRDLAAPLGENGSSPLLLGAEAALWGEKIDHRTVDAVAWPRGRLRRAALVAGRRVHAGQLHGGLPAPRRPPLPPRAPGGRGDARRRGRAEVRPPLALAPVPVVIVA